MFTKVERLISLRNLRPKKKEGFLKIISIFLSKELFRSFTSSLSFSITVNFFGNLLTCKAKEGGSNYAQWCNAQFDKEILAAQKVTSQKSRTAHYKKAQKIFAKELPWVPLAHARVYRAFSKKLKGYKIHPIGVEEFYPLEWAK